MRILIRVLSIIGLFALLYSCNKHDQKEPIDAGERKIVGKFSRYCDSSHLKKAYNLYSSQKIIQDNHRAKVIDLHYYITQAAWASYNSSRYLQQISFSDYLAENSSIYKDEVKYMQIRNKLFIDNFSKSKIAHLLENWELKADQPLYIERSLLEAWVSNNIQEMSSLAKQKPLLYYRLIGDPSIIPKSIFELHPLEGSLDQMDQLILAWESRNMDFIDSQVKLNPFQNFSYSEPIDSIPFYSSESLLLLAMYFSRELEKILEQNGAKSNPETSFYNIWIHLLSENYAVAVQYLKNYIDSGILAENDAATYQAIVDALTTKSSVEYNIADTSIIFTPQFLPLVKYWYYCFKASTKESDLIHANLDNISSMLTTNWTEFTNYYKEDIGDICIYTETLYTLGLYHLNNNDIDLAEKYFTAIYDIKRSFSIKDLISCGKIFQFQPTTFLPYAAAIFNKNVLMKDLVLQTIKIEIQDHPYYLIPSNDLNLKLIDSSIPEPVPVL